jgi:hypothetical protein
MSDSIQVHVSERDSLIANDMAAVASANANASASVASANSLSGSDSSGEEEFSLNVDESDEPVHLINPNSVEFKVALYTAFLHPFAARIGKRPLRILLIFSAFLLSLTSFITLSPFQFFLGGLIVVLVWKHDYKQLGFLVNTIIFIFINIIFINLNFV